LRLRKVADGDHWVGLAVAESIDMTAEQQAKRFRISRRPFAYFPPLRAALGLALPSAQACAHEGGDVIVASELGKARCSCCDLPQQTNVFGMSGYDDPDMRCRRQRCHANCELVHCQK
jgi:putative hemolysin